MGPDVPDHPVVRASDAEREAVVARLQVAVAEGRIDLDEFGERVQAAYAATTTADLAGLLADLPAEGTTVQLGAPGPAPVGVVGESAQAGAVSSVFEDVRIDLRQLRTSADTVYLQLGTVFGDVDVVVGEGVDAGIEGWTVFGDRKTQLPPGRTRAAGGRRSTGSPPGGYRRRNRHADPPAGRAGGSARVSRRSRTGRRSTG